jgi:hypothetical protein
MRSDAGKFKKDLTGKVFNRLTVIGFSGFIKQGQNKVSIWSCKCTCGKVKDIKGTHLSRGDTKSCGCLNTDVLPDNAAKKRTKYLQYMNHASARKLEWSLSYEHFSSLLKMSCFYCRAAADPLGGVDRVNNMFGYHVGNAVPCCKMCNRCKSDLTADNFLEWARSVG